MEAETTPNVALKPPPLNSDQLNYLIWRYLQEAGYGEAAVKLQRDWKVEPDNLPFAKHIKGQALVSLVQKGLRYHHLSLTIDESGRLSKTLSPSTFFFGPESGRASNSDSPQEPLYRVNEVQRALSPMTNLSGIPKKRETDPNGSLDPNSASAKRSRKVVTTDRNGNGVRKTSTSASDALSTMEVDHVNGMIGSVRNIRSPSIGGENMHDESAVNGTASDTRMDIDMEALTPGALGTGPVPTDAQDSMLPVVHTLTNGESVGIQVAPAKVANLGPSTTILSLSEKSHVTKSVWRPADGSLLAVAGDHFCGAWKNTNAPLQEEGTNMNYQDLIRFDESTLITAVAWEPHGGLLAIATYSEQAGQLRLFEGRELALIENLPASQRAITSLRWLPSAFQLIGIAPYDDQGLENSTSSTVLLWDFSDNQFSASPLPLPIPELLLDIDTIHLAGQSIVCAAGGNAVYCFRGNKELSIERKWTSSATNGVSWTFVRCAGQGDRTPVVVAASSESPRLWLPDRDVARSDAHNAPITALELRPRAFHYTNAASIPDFATSSMDGTIKLWRFDNQNNTIETLYRLGIDQGFPIMSLSFSPDGFCLAGASYGNARIWNAEHGYSLMASWEGNGNEWRGTHLRDEDAMSAGGMSSINGDGGALSADHSLAWDEDSKKLAFSLASQVAVINFQR